MADITKETHPAQIKWIDEELRPIAEDVRNLWARAKDARMSYDDTHDAIIGSTATDLIQDRREAEGTSRLNARDVSRCMDAVTLIIDLIEGTLDPTDGPTQTRITIDKTRFIDLLTVRTLRD